MLIVSFLYATFFVPWDNFVQHCVVNLVMLILFSVIQLEKEAIVKGVPIGQSLDIEIPPPRPKRKPNNPYPRKTSLGTSASQVEVKDGKISNPVSSSCQSKVTVEHEVWVILYASCVTFHFF